MPLVIDCSGWDVSKVTKYADFNIDAPGVEPPVWKTA